MRAVDAATRIGDGPACRRLVVRQHFSPLFFFNDTATTEIYTLSLHDALPISKALRLPHAQEHGGEWLCLMDAQCARLLRDGSNRKSLAMNAHGLPSAPHKVTCL